MTGYSTTNAERQKTRDHAWRIATKRRPFSRRAGKNARSTRRLTPKSGGDGELRLDWIVLSLEIVERYFNSLAVFFDAFVRPREDRLAEIAVDHAEGLRNFENGPKPG